MSKDKTNSRDIYSDVVKEDYCGVLKIGVLTPSFTWTGKKMLRENFWHQVFSFFDANHKKNATEALVRLYYNAKKELNPWEFVVHPQVASFASVEDTISTKLTEEILGQGYESFGTIHSHGTMAASQSSVDEEDEFKNNGVHITLGELHKPVWSIDMRWNFKGDFFPVNPQELFESNGEEDLLTSLLTVDNNAFIHEDGFSEELARITVDEPTAYHGFNKRTSIDYSCFSNKYPQYRSSTQQFRNERTFWLEELDDYINFVQIHLPSSPIPWESLASLILVVHFYPHLAQSDHYRSWITQYELEEQFPQVFNGDPKTILSSFSDYFSGGC